ncbi:uncharacterized protein Z520_02749 [Fonsecaea multimorphosa CBS 102226]|uniref:Transcription factor domain-containing protein n=1 Tax=Fonsecaea multimorphosa CBS 102226 TaxID=1442371 RepID=A0A0D2IVW2_9EURO|nr:uncharacterized protein Z520_02749 [Fonsecaea multimorphosa CBS 102226]KIY01197.1 hypothetical protein Z520_02749 [Fonsecaea multimorphosa CBS 102226]OAL28809.1 hypothetical protein AYO22_02674 [Fonsecaea multimorphosa]
MRPNKPSAASPNVFWLDAKTPTNFKSTSDFRDKNIIAVRAQQYSAQKRLEQASLFFEWQNYGSQLLHGQSSSLSGYGPELARQKKHLNATPKDPSSERSSRDGPSGNNVYAQQELLRVRALGRSLRTIWADEVGTSNGARILVPAQKKVYRSYVCHEAVMHALLAYCWSVLARLHPNNKELYYSCALDHETQGIRVLQRVISSGPITGDDVEVAVQTILLLCCSAVYRSNLDALFHHLQGLKQMIQCVGGLDGLSWIRKEILIYLVVRAAAATGTCSVLDYVDWDPGQWWREDTSHCETTPDLVTGRKRSAELGLGLPSPSASPRTSDFRCIFAELRELVEVENLKRRMVNDDPEHINKLFRWSFLRRQAVRARILDYWYVLTEPTNAVEPCSRTSAPTTVHHASVGMCLCLALHLVMAFGLEASLLHGTWVSTIQVWHIMLLRCMHKLGFESEEIDQSHPDALDLLWTYGIGAYVEQLSLTHVLRKEPNFWVPYTAERVDIQWFSARFGILARRLGYRQYQDVAVLFEKRYVHIASLQDSVLSKIFDFGC